MRTSSDHGQPVDNLIEKFLPAKTQDMLLHWYAAALAITPAEPIVRSSTLVQAIYCGDCLYAVQRPMQEHRMGCTSERIALPMPCYRMQVQAAVPIHAVLRFKCQIPLQTKLDALRPMYCCAERSTLVLLHVPTVFAFKDSPAGQTQTPSATSTANICCPAFSLLLVKPCRCPAIHGDSVHHCMT